MARGTDVPMTAVGGVLRAWWPAVAYMALIAFMSSRSAVPVDLDDVPLRDKGVHFVEFAVLAALIARALHLRARPPLDRRAMLKLALWTIGLTTLWGYLDELHQAFVPGRTSDAWDVLADFIGAIAGSAAYWARAMFTSRSPAR